MEFQEALWTIICLTDIPDIVEDNPFFQGMEIREDNTVMKVTTTRQWKDGKVIQSKREYSAD
jgi:hypothetical protein